MTSVTEQHLKGKYPREVVSRLFPALCKVFNKKQSSKCVPVKSVCTSWFSVCHGVCKASGACLEQVGQQPPWRNCWDHTGHHCQTCCLDSPCGQHDWACGQCPLPLLDSCLWRAKINPESSIARHRLHQHQSFDRNAYSDACVGEWCACGTFHQLGMKAWCLRTGPFPSQRGGCFRTL